MAQEKRRLLDGLSLGVLGGSEANVNAWLFANEGARTGKQQGLAFPACNAFRGALNQSRVNPVRLFA